MLQQNPNVAVWQTADEYLGAAEILLDYNRLRPAAILAALSLELCLKCFLARRIAPWTATSSRGHSLVSLFNEISLDDRKALLKHQQPSTLRLISKKTSRDLIGISRMAVISTSQMLLTQ